MSVGPQVTSGGIVGSDDERGGARLPRRETGSLTPEASGMPSADPEQPCGAAQEASTPEGLRPEADA